MCDWRWKLLAALCDFTLLIAQYNKNENKGTGFQAVCAGTTLRIWVLFNDKQTLVQASHWIDRLAWKATLGHRMCRMTFSKGKDACSGHVPRRIDMHSPHHPNPTIGCLASKPFSLFWPISCQTLGVKQPPSKLVNLPYLTSLP